MVLCWDALADGPFQAGMGEQALYDVTLAATGDERWARKSARLRALVRSAQEATS